MWQTIYIKGREGFKSKIKKSLSKVLIEGKDYIKGTSVNGYKLYWISPDITLKQFKLAISSKYVWKYRLNFYKEIEEKSINSELTQDELNLIKKYGYF